MFTFIQRAISGRVNHLLGLCQVFVVLWTKGKCRCVVLPCDLR